MQPSSWSWGLCGGGGKRGRTGGYNNSRCEEVFPGLPLSQGQRGSSSGGGTKWRGRYRGCRYSDMLTTSHTCMWSRRCFFAESKKSLSPVDKAAVDVLQRCPHFLPSSSSSPSTPPYVPLCVLDCLSHCLYALRLNQQALLPEVHKVGAMVISQLGSPVINVLIDSVGVAFICSTS